MEWRDVREDLLKNEAVRAAYEQKKPQYEIIKQLIEQRKKLNNDPGRLGQTSRHHPIGRRPPGMRAWQCDHPHGQPHGGCSGLCSDTGTQKMGRIWPPLRRSLSCRGAVCCALVHPRTPAGVSARPAARPSTNSTGIEWRRYGRDLFAIGCQRPPGYHRRGLVAGAGVVGLMGLRTANGPGVAEGSQIALL